MKEVLNHLSMVAWEQAAANGRRRPHERPEFLHLPMKVVRGVPIFDVDRMRDDQIADTCEQLERITGKVAYGKSQSTLEAFIQAFGKIGFRLQDAVEATGSSARTVRRHLQEMTELGTIMFREEKTRGKGSRRKRYFTTDRYDSAADAIDDANAVGAVLNDGGWNGKYWGNDGGTGIVHHGQGVYGVTACGCPRCSYAFRSALIGEAVSAARRNGGTGFEIGLPFVTEDRLAADREYLAAIERGYAMRGADAQEEEDDGLAA